MKSFEINKIFVEDLLEGIVKDLDSSTRKLPISKLTVDSREVNKGSIFFALEGNSQDGNYFIDEALSKGASIILSDKLRNKEKNVIFIPNLKKVVGKISSRFYGDPSEKMETFLVTGTNGKTTCVEMLSKIIKLLGKKSGYISTIGNSLEEENQKKKKHLTTPDSIELQRLLFEMRKKDTEIVVVEASSHGLHQSRLQGIKVDTAILTSFSQDHLDYHKNIDNYAKAKKRLFIDLKPNVSILNIDNKFGSALYKELKLKKERRKVFSLSNKEAADFEYTFSRDSEGSILVNLSSSSFGSHYFTLNTVSSALASNVVCAVASLLVKGIELSEVYPLFKDLKFPKGRMELISINSKDKCFIDYAHTPEALEKSLLELREAFNGNIWCIFGCGGDRDKSKRPLMGKIAEKLSDNLVITNDNPRNEEEMEIINQIMLKTKNNTSIKIIKDRELAIGFCLKKIAEDSQPNILLIAGKGHEQYQEVQGKKIPFRDVDIVNSFLKPI